MIRLLVLIVGFAMLVGCAPPASNDNVGNDNVVDNTNDNVDDNTNDNVDDNVNENAASELIFPANYKDTFTEVRNCRVSIEHQENIRVFVNDIGAEAYLNNEDPLPEGTIVVKEVYDGIGCGDEAELVHWSAMVKMADGFDPDDGNWRWQESNVADGSIIFDDKTTCIVCHDDDECIDRDYMCTEE